MIETDRRGGVAIVTLASPERRNALTLEDADDLVETLSQIGIDRRNGAAVLTAEGPAFCAGADRSVLEQVIASRDRGLLARFYAAFRAVRSLPIPIVAAVGGPAVGAGLNLVLASDLVIASPRAEFCSRFVQLGLHPGGGHCQLLVARVGLALASRMVLSGISLSANEAHAAGLVDEVVDAGSELGMAVAVAEQIVRAPRPLVVETKRTLRESQCSTYDEAVEAERNRQVALLPDTLRGPR